jgi:ABC-type Fe3+/spermidine/putrescine transport system ATPase subunit
MQIELRQLQKNVGITFVFVTHDQEEALSMSDRIAVMGKGVVLQIAPPKALYETPSNVEVASFIGSINLIPATVKSLAGGTATLEGPGFGQFTASAIEGLKAGDKVTAAIRPEKLNLTSEKPSGGVFVEGKIQAAAYLGDRSHYQVFVKGRDAPVSVAAQNVERGMTTGFDAAKPVFISWDPKSVILLRS